MVYFEVQGPRVDELEPDLFFCSSSLPQMDNENECLDIEDDLADLLVAYI